MSLEFDLYPRADPIGGTKLVTFAKLQLGEVRKEYQGTGSGRFALRGDTAEAQFIDPKGLQYVRVRDTAVSATIPVAGFFTDHGDFEALTVKRTRKLTFGGAGALSILARCVMDEQTYLDSEGGKDPTDSGQDVWNLHLQGSWIGSVPHALGSFLHRVMREATHADRPRQPLDGVTWDFDASTDSNGNPWTPYEGEFTAMIGESVLSVVQRLMQLGLIVEMDAHTFELHAYNPANPPGVDKSGGAWGAGVVRFQTASAGTVATGNIKSEAKRGIQALVKRSHLLVGSELTYVWRDEPSADIVWEGAYRILPGDTAALNAAADAQLAARTDAGDTARLRISYGNSVGTGRYRPITHFTTGDTATLHSGTGAMDWDEADKIISAITWQKRRGGTTPDVFVDFGSTYRAFDDREFQVATGAGCQCIRLCGDDEINRLLGLTGASLKVSSTSPTFTKERACDGDYAQASHWSAEITEGVDEEYWAADLGSSLGVQRYVVHQGFQSGVYTVNDAASEMKIYGSDSGAAWTWLAAGELPGDPASNGWTLVATVDGTTGMAAGVISPSPSTFRYWLLRASVGPADGVGDGWNVQEFELWDGSGTSGTSPQAARCDHTHHHNDLEGRSTVDAHPASAVSVLDTSANFTATDVEGVLAELAADSSVGAVRVHDLAALHRFLIFANRSYNLNDDGNTGTSYPEDTLEGFRKAAEAGADGVEIDIQQNADGSWVAMHDTTVTRTTSSTGNVNSKTDAQWAALAIDGGFGYNAVRHAGLYTAPFLTDILEAITPYGCLAMLELKGGDELELVQYLTDLGWVERTIISGVFGDTAAMKALNPNITLQHGGAGTGADYDSSSVPTASVVSLAFVQAFAPLWVHSYVPIADFGTDETTIRQNMYDRGVRSWETYDVTGSVAFRDGLTSTATGAPDDATYLVTTAHAGLSAEVAVGATPGGELGGTWTSPTVDATHSGSAHHAQTHATAHASGGADAVKLDDLAAPDDNTDLNASTSAHGLLQKLPGGTTNFLRADGTFATPSGTSVGPVVDLDTTGSNTSSVSFVNTNMAVAVAASTNYIFRAIVYFNTNAAAVGIQFAVTVPAGATLKVGQYVPTTASSTTSTTVSIGSTTTSGAVIRATTTGPGASNVMAIIEGTLQVAGTAGSLTLQYASETATQVDIEAGSYLMAQAI